MNDEHSHGMEYWRKSCAVEVNPDEHPCPVCGETLFGEGGSYEICELCGWEDDPVQLADPEFRGGANQVSLNQARAAWVSKKSSR